MTHLQVTKQHQNYSQLHNVMLALFRRNQTRDNLRNHLPILLRSIFQSLLLIEKWHIIELSVRVYFCTQLYKKIYVTFFYYDLKKIILVCKLLALLESLHLVTSPSSSMGSASCILSFLRLSLIKLSINADFSQCTNSKHLDSWELTVRRLR